MSSFHMHSRVGWHPNGAEIISEDEVWVELTPDLYRTYWAEVRADAGERLLQGITLATQVPLPPDTTRVHFVDDDLPVCMIEVAPQHWQQFRDTNPVIPIDREGTEAQGLCHRNRLPAADGKTVCLFPVLLAPTAPRPALAESPSLAHEMVHLRHTLTPAYGEAALRMSYWNADLEMVARTQFDSLLRHRLISFLREEWEACATNMADGARHRAFTNLYIPVALRACAQQLNWWLNDEGRYVNVARTCALISTTLADTLLGIHYHDDRMHPADWQDVSACVFREAFRRWRKTAGDFTEMLTEVLNRGAP
jgi:hypothetical protein